MRTLTSLPLLLLTSALTLTVGCDDEYDAEIFADDADEITERCVGAGCIKGGIGNTSRIGDHPLSNLSRAFNQNAPNQTSNVRITGGIGFINGAQQSVIGIDIEQDGELRLNLQTAGWIQGTAVKNAELNVTVVPHDPSRPTLSGKLWIGDVVCAPGKYAPGMTICAYEFLTNIKPSDTLTYPQSTKRAGWYQTCPNENEQGSLTAWEKYSSVLSPNVTLVAPTGATPRIDVSGGMFINGCLNGAVSKGQYHLNAFYDANAFRGLQPSQRSAMLLMWMAWHAGQSRTIPGQMISPHDPIGGLFTWTNDPAWGIEAGYGSTGATCRGGPFTTGLHRYIPDPVLNLAGWSSLPHCTPLSLPNMATLGVKVENW